MPNFDRSTVKHGTQNIQNDCQQWLPESFRVHHIRFRQGLSPGPRWGSILQRSLDLAGLRGHVLLRRMGDEKESEKGEQKGRGRERDGTPPPLRKCLDPPLKYYKVKLYSYRPIVIYMYIDTRCFVRTNNSNVVNASLRTTCGQTSLDRLNLNFT